MKKVITVFVIAAALTSCSPGRWVGGNAKHYQQRADAKLVKIQYFAEKKQN